MDIIKILILGSNGFIGKNLKYLLQINDNYVIQCIERKDIDIMDKHKLNTFFSYNKPSIVINCCGIVGSSELNKNNNQLSILNDNIVLNINILECCQKYNVSKLIMFSTYRLFNNNELIEEEDNNYFTQDINSSNIGYLLSKHLLNIQLKLFQKYYNTKILCLILPNIFGLFDNFCINGRIIPSLICKLKHAKDNNTDLFINSNSNNTVNLIFINDIIYFIKESIINNINGNIIIFNTNGTINLKDLTCLLKKLCNFNNNIIFESEEITDESNMIQPTMTKFNEFFPNYKFHNLEESLLQTINYFNFHY